jgi:hypothetical protein
VIAWVGMVAWGRESGCHGEGGEEEGGELHCCGIGVIGESWMSCIVKRIKMGGWRERELSWRLDGRDT